MEFRRPESVFFWGQQIRISDLEFVTKGGEGEIFRIPKRFNPKGETRDFFLKLYKSPDHPDYNDPKGDPMEMKIARLTSQKRLEVHQTKLASMMSLKTPENVMNASDLAWLDSTQKVVWGYIVLEIKNPEPLLSYLDAGFRDTAGITRDMMVDLCVQLIVMVAALHALGIVLGDINWLNLLSVVKQKGKLVLYLVDLDSMQWGQYKSRAYTQLMVDPLLCDPKQDMPVLAADKEYSPGADWYIVRIIIIKLLTGASPYDGLYKPTDKVRVAPLARPLKRITFLNPKFKDQCVYPMKAVPLSQLPPQLVQDWVDCFVHDKRVPIDKNLVLAVIGKAISTPVAPPVVTGTAKTVVINGVKVTSIKNGGGNLLYVRVRENGSLVWLISEGNFIIRENGVKFPVRVDPTMTYGIDSTYTYVGLPSEGVILRFSDDGSVENILADRSHFQNRIEFAANDLGLFYSQGGFVSSNKFGDIHMYGPTLGGNTKLWVGDKIGFGFYNERLYTKTLIFDPAKRMLFNDTLLAPRIKGQLVRTNAVMSDSFVWFFYAVKETTGLVNYAMVFKDSGELLATGKAEEGSDSWLASIFDGQSAPLGNILFVPTDEGIVRVKVEQGALIVKTVFEATAQYVDSSSKLYVSKTAGIIVVRGQEIIALQM
jgi:hypothetical protein